MVAEERAPDSISDLGPSDVEELNNPQSPTLGGMVRSLATLASDVGELKTSVRWMAWAVGIGLTVSALAVATVGIIAALK